MKSLSTNYFALFVTENKRILMTRSTYPHQSKHEPRVLSVIHIAAVAMKLFCWRKRRENLNVTDSLSPAIHLGTLTNSCAISINASGTGFEFSAAKWLLAIITLLLSIMHLVMIASRTIQFATEVGERGQSGKQAMTK